tara:strand:+ start:3677 stop:4507 length:831 start_codon:yes stop_codon:yes gene_type:complete
MLVMNNLINSLKFKLIRIIESNPLLNLVIYNNISFFKPFLPHEKDYYGIKLLINNRINDAIIDVGGNLGISAMGFRELGYKNKIFLFEPNKYLFEKYINNKLIKDYKNIFAYNFALGFKEEIKDFYYPYYKKSCLHYFCSFDKKYIKNSLKITFNNKKFRIINNPMKLKKFDKLSLMCRPKFIKIDVEGFDYEVLKGMKKNINKYKPIILVEFNKSNFFKIKKFLNNYNVWVYFYKTNEFKIFNKNMIDIQISRTNKTNLMSIRNIFFIPKSHKWN